LERLHIRNRTTARDDTRWIVLTQTGMAEASRLIRCAGGGPLVLWLECGQDHDGGVQPEITSNNSTPAGTARLKDSPSR